MCWTPTGDSLALTPAGQNHVTPAFAILQWITTSLNPLIRKYYHEISGKGTIENTPLVGGIFAVTPTAFAFDMGTKSTKYPDA